MKIKELIKVLQTLHPEAEVFMALDEPSLVRMEIVGYDEAMLWNTKKKIKAMPYTLLGEAN